MSINIIINEKGITKYRLAKISGVPHATLNDICSGKTRIEKCSAETIRKLAQALCVTMESLIEALLKIKSEKLNDNVYMSMVYPSIYKII